MFIDCHADLHLPLLDCYEECFRLPSVSTCLFQIGVTLLLYNIRASRKAQDIHKTFSFIFLSFKRLKYEIKHENSGQIYSLKNRDFLFPA